MQIYTRTGDKGKTKIIGGKALYKDDKRIEAYGTVDELNSLIGVVRTEAKDFPEIDEDLLKVQHLLFDCGNDLATPADNPKYKFRVEKADIEFLESRIDYYADKAPEVKSFVLPGGSKLSALLHLARTFCRRAERRAVSFMKANDSNIYALQFINRLSDLLFALARYVNAKLGIEDVLYSEGGKVFHDISKEDIYKEAPDLEVEDE